MRNKFYILFLLFPLISWGQADQKPSLNDFQRQVKYDRSSDYEGPKVNRTQQPANLEKAKESEYYESSGNGLNYSDDDIQRARKKSNTKEERNSGSSSGSGDGTGMQEPPISKGTVPKLDSPDLPESNFKFGLSSFWGNVILITLLVLVVLVIVYFILKNKRNKEPIQALAENEVVFTNIELSELELRLQEAFSNEDYRTCVRIYFTFILKELIRLRWISWKKERTNYDYILQLKSEENRVRFSHFASIYDLVWYGEYPLSLSEYQLLEKDFKAYYSHLNQQDA